MDLKRSYLVEEPIYGLVNNAQDGPTANKLLRYSHGGLAVRVETPLQDDRIHLGPIGGVDTATVVGGDGDTVEPLVLGVASGHDDRVATYVEIGSLGG